MISLGRLSRVLALSIILFGALAAGAAQAQPARQRPIGGEVLSHLPVAVQPTNNGTGFAGVQDVISPVGLQIISANTITHPPGSSQSGIVSVQNPAIRFQFPITPDINAYTGAGLNHAYPTIGWQGTLTMEACLTPAEASKWPGATNKQATDNATCPSVDDLVHSQIIGRNWYEVASQHLDLYVVQNGTFQFIPSLLPVNLQQIVTPTRLHIDGYTFYYTKVHTGPNNYNDACPGNVCQGGHEETRTSPFKVVVMPTAMVQLKVLPQTLIYLPPGNVSFASYKVTATYSTTVTAGAITQIDNSQANDEWTEDVGSVGGTASIAKIFNAGYSSTDDTRWDTKTTVKAGQALEHDVAGVNQRQVIINRQVKATAVNVPGAAGTVANEPFWSDVVVMLVHPQFAVWDFYGKTTVQLVAAASAGTLPDDIGYQVSELDACAQGKAPDPAGLPLLVGAVAVDTLTPKDCAALAVLDPFYGHGQSANVGGRGQLFLGTQPYGTPTSGPPSPTLIDLQQIDSSQVSVTNQGTQTYAATAEDIVATTQSQGIKLGVSTGSLIPELGLGFTDDITLKQGSTSDTSHTMTLTFKNSSVTTNRVDVAVEGSISDTVNRGYTPEVEVFLDTIFGGLMFVDPTAPVVPCKPQPMCTVRVNNGGTTLQRAQ